MLLESLTDDEVEVLPEEPEQLKEPIVEEEQLPLLVLSLHALKGSHGPHTMRFKVEIGTTTTIFLVDTGNTHNFLSTNLVNKLNLPVCQQSQLRVTMVDGRQLFTKGICQNIT